MDLCFVNLLIGIFVKCIMNIFMIKNEKSVRKIHGVTSWYQSLGLRDLDVLSGISELKLRI